MNIELLDYIDNYQVKINKLYTDKFWKTVDQKQWVYVDDALIEWLGYLKSNGKFKYNHLIKDNFKEIDDYKIYNYDDLMSIFHSPLEENETHKEILYYKEQLKNAHNRTTHLILSPRCFKKSLMMIKTAKANQIRNDYIDIEELCLDFHRFLLQNKKNIKQIDRIINDEKHIQYYDHSILFLAKIEDNLIKFGLTNNINNKIAINKTKFNMFEIIYIAECIDVRLIETVLKDYAKEHNKLTSKIYKGTNYTTLINIDDNFTIDMIINKVKSECHNQYDYTILLKNYNQVIEDNHNLRKLNTNLNNEIELLKKQIK